MTFEMIERGQDLKIKEAILYGECAMYEFDVLEHSAVYEGVNTSSLKDKVKSLFEKAKAALKKMWDSFMGFLQKIFSKLKESKMNDTLKSIKDDASKDPEFAKLTIEIPDPVEIERNYKYALSIVKRYKQRIGSGESLTNSDLEIMARAKEKLKNTRMKRFAIGAGVAAILSLGVVATKTAMDNSKLRDDRDSSNRIIDKLNSDMEKTMNALNDMKSVHSQDTNKINELLDDNGKLKDRVAQLQHLSKFNSGLYDDAKNKLYDKDAQLSRYETELRVANKTIYDYNNMVSDKNSQLKKMEDEKEHLNVGIRKLGSKYSEVIRKNSELKKQLIDDRNSRDEDVRKHSGEIARYIGNINDKLRGILACDQTDLEIKQAILKSFYDTSWYAIDYAQLRGKSGEVMDKALRKGLEDYVNRK